jgi:hypothetical protein
MPSTHQTSRGVTFRRPTLDEKAEQAQILTLVAALGGVAYVLGTRRAQFCGVCGGRNQDQGTRQTPGIADLLVILPPAPTTYAQPGTPWVPIWIEVKGRGGSLSLEQVAFKRYCDDCKHPHIVGGLDAVVEFLEQRGWLVARTLAHGRTG